MEEIFSKVIPRKLENNKIMRKFSKEFKLKQ
jgi:hypothetical protein